MSARGAALAIAHSFQYAVLATQTSGENPAWRYQGSKPFPHSILLLFLTIGTREPETTGAASELEMPECGVPPECILQNELTCATAKLKRGDELEEAEGKPV